MSDQTPFPRQGPVLSIQGLSTSFFTYRGEVQAVKDLNIDLMPGEMLGIVGETGAGKTVLVHSILKQVRFPGRIITGRVLLEGRDLLSLTDAEMRSVRGEKLAVIVSNPRASLNPLETIGRQLGRAVLAHTKLRDADVHTRVIQALEAVRIPDPNRRHDSYPHELSVGMAQRVIIAMALLHSPQVIIADEPTAGLDVTVQRQVLNLMKALIEDLGSSTVIVTRDLGIVAQYCDRLGIMRDGVLLEDSPVRSFFRGPVTDYGRELLERTLAVGTDAAVLAVTSPVASVPRIEVGEPPVYEDELAPVSLTEPGQEPLLSIRDLVKHFPLHRSRLTVKAVNGISFDLMRGEALGLVGESGSGKTTVGRLILRLIDPTSGSVTFEGQEITKMGQRQLRPLRERIQMVFQEPHASLNPNMSIGMNIEQPLLVAGELDRQRRRERVRELLQLVQLRDRQMTMYPHNLSAGQAQRVGVARAMATNPRLIVLDEPTSLLDIAVRGEILELLNRVKDESGVSYIFISHDLTAVRSVCTRIAIMYLGKIIELGNIDDLFALQRHPYSRALLASVLHPDPDVHLPDFALAGEIPSPVELPTGCVLYSRCPIAQADCDVAHPPLAEQVPGWLVACYHSNDLLAQELVARDDALQDS